jgi:hypothetical protein
VSPADGLLAQPRRGHVDHLDVSTHADDDIQRVILSYVGVGEEMSLTQMLELTEPAVVAPMTAITRAEMKRALLALERDGHFVRRKFKSMWLWRRVAYFGSLSCRRQARRRGSSRM